MQCNDNRESFYHSRLLEFAHNRNRLDVFKLRCITEQIAYVSNDAIIEGNCKGVFQVPSDHSENFYEVNAELGICQCHLEEITLSESTCMRSPIISMYMYIMHQRPAMMTVTLQQKLHMVRTVQVKTTTVRLEMTFPLPTEKERL